MVAHRRTGHHALCGLEGWPCVECETAWEDAKSSGRRAMLVALDLVAEGDSPTDDVQALMWAGTYQTYLSDAGSRMGLMSWPQMYSDIALVGDAVAHRAQRKMMADIKERSKT